MDKLPNKSIPLVREYLQAIGVTNKILSQATLFYQQNPVFLPKLECTDMHSGGIYKIPEHLPHLDATEYQSCLMAILFHVNKEKTKNIQYVEKVKFVNNFLVANRQLLLETAILTELAKLYSDEASGDPEKLGDSAIEIYNPFVVNDKSGKGTLQPLPQFSAFKDRVTVRSLYIQFSQGVEKLNNNRDNLCKFMRRVVLNYRKNCIPIYRLELELKLRQMKKIDVEIVIDNEILAMYESTLIDCLQLLDQVYNPTDDFGYFNAELKRRTNIQTLLNLIADIEKLYNTPYAS
jgi:hypothetical protein